MLDVVEDQEHPPSGEKSVDIESSWVDPPRVPLVYGVGD